MKDKPISRNTDDNIHLPVQYTQRTNNGKIIPEILPCHYRFLNKTKALFQGEKPAYVPENKVVTMKERKHQAFVDSYKNPIQLAKKYEEMLLNDGFNQSKLAKYLGISRVRVTQILSLLKLPKKMQDYVLKHGKDEMITERKLRKILADKIL